MADPAIPSSSSSPRLKFIDMARSLAILLMLEGHFVGLMLMDDYRVADHPVYQVWNWLRGIAAPLFFTVAGLVFVYLLTGHTQPRFFANPRVTKGLKRAAVLLFWGYALQLNLLQLPAYLRGDFQLWNGAFHVLQSIAVALVLLIGVFGLHRFLRWIPLFVMYLAGGALVLGAYGYLKALPADAFVPEGAPSIVQNPIKGPHSVFPVAPWAAYSLYGGAIGALLRRHRDRVAEWWVPLAFLGGASVLQLAGWLAHAAGEGLPNGVTVAQGYSWFHGRLAQIVLLLGVLVWIEHRLRLGDSWFMRVGKHTFAIYVIHVIILYGGLFGVGLGDRWERALTPLQAGFGALLFMTFFVWLVPYFDSVARAWQRLVAGGRVR
jgi:uncharacterized membrane protein